MESTKQESMKTEPIAIIGMGCLFPKAHGTKEYWRLIVNGEDGITEVPETHWSAADYFDADKKRQDHTYCSRGGFLSPISFDPTEFGIPPAALEATDTSQILSLVVAKMALEDAGYVNGKPFDHDRTGVIVGATGTQELVINLGSRLGHPIWRKALKEAGIADEKTDEVVARIANGYVPWQESSFPGLLGNVIAGRICNRLDLGGTNCVVDAACASSMSAINLAVLDLAAGRSDMIITGGVDTLNDIFMHMCFAKTYVLSETGDIRPFSAKSDGTVLGEGIGMLVLKRLSDARKDNDRIYALIKSVGCSSDGKSQSIYAPRAEGQAKALRMAYRDAGIDPATIELIEAHGTGTRVGDAVEFQALKDVFGDSVKNGNRCAVGTVKSMIGHAKAAAGAAGLIKAALALHHKVIPPTLKVAQPDPHLGIEESPFHISQTSRPWAASTQHPRRSGVSAFGFGGSNFHIVLEEYQQPKSVNAWDGNVEIIALSAPTKESLLQKIDRLAERCHAQKNIAETLFGLMKLRNDFKSDDPFRILMIWEAPQSNPEGLKSLMAEAVKTVEKDAFSQDRQSNNIYFGTHSPKGKLAFLFPGQGSQYAHMGKDLLCLSAAAQNSFDLFNRHFESEYRQSLGDLVYPNAERQKDKTFIRRLTATDVAQPAIGAVSLAMLSIMQAFKVQPDATGGHSFGELTALYAGGRIDQNALATLALQRGKYMAAGGRDSGAMLAVKAPLQDLEKMVREQLPDVIVANRNSHSQGVLSGTAPAIAKAETVCRQAGYAVTRLKVAAAFHSELVAHAVAPFKQALTGIDILPAKIPVYANTPAKPYPEEADAARELLGNQLLNPVNFVDQIEHMYRSGIDTFIEIGPRTVLTGLTKAILAGRQAHILALDHSGGSASGIRDLAHALCRIAALGHCVDLSLWENNNRAPQKQRMSIPVTGANFKPKPQKVPASPKAHGKAQRPVQTQPPAVKSVEPVRQPAPIATNTTHEMAAAYPKTVKPNNTNERSTIMDTHQAKQSHIINDALRVVQEGLKSMQAIQSQTAETHQKFLETQTQASKTLQAMMLDTQRMAEAAIGSHISVDTAPTVNSARLPKQATRKPAAPRKTPVLTAPQQPLVQQAPAAPPVEPAKPQAAPQQSASTTKSNHQNVAAAMLTIVSELTGYPENMLGLDMDIEADLGIDSIKRVEILSTFEERMPDMPPISPDIMGTLKTLGEIADYITNSGKSASAPSVSAKPAPETAPPVAQAAATATQQKIEAALMETVSQLTGYPVEMLDAGMDIEADLGIDSIKRVEILSAFEEKMPNLPPISPDVIGTLKTLGQICDYLSEQTPEMATESAEPASTATPPTNGYADIEKNLLEVVSQLTGYPADMLSADMDIEADLGIDSIKRVEILSAFEERMPGLPPISPDVMSTLKTLGQIGEYLAKAGAEATTPNQPEATPPANAAKEASGSHLSEIEATLLSVVSQLTGYPLDMLSADMDIEADLGIDSIKRVEILSAFEEQMPNLPPVSPDVIGTLKTLGQISAYLADSSGTEGITQPPEEPPVTTSAPAPQTNETAAQIVKRYEIVATAQPYAGEDKIGIPFGRKIYIAGEGALADALAEALARIQIDSRIIPYTFENTGAENLNDAGGLILLSPEAPLDDFQTTQLVKNSFRLAHDFAAPLKVSGLDGGAVFGTVTRLDGQFGFSERPLNQPIEGGLAGLAKTAAIEWPEVCCHAIDVAPDWPVSDEMAATILENMMQTGPVETGLAPNERTVLNLVETPYPQGETGLSPEDVVVVSGGARGVTAACAIALAREARPFIALLGRTPLSADEPEWLQPLTTPAEIKKAILENDFSGQKVTPATVEKSFKRYMANREINDTLAKIEAAGGRAGYFPVDVRDRQALADLFDSLRRQQGAIKAVVHGAGVLEDRFIADKSMEQFANVFDTKVDGFKALMQAAASDPLTHIVIFSSVAARFGNKGQVDYAMANEALNKMAQKEAKTRPGCTVTAINWGPWDGGMVTPALKKEFQRNHIELIPIEAGAACLVREMSATRPLAAEVVIGAPIAPETFAVRQPAVSAAAADKKQRTPNDLAVTLTSEVDTRRYPILNAHKLNGRPVVPFALMAEWFGHGALHENPGLQLLGLDDMRLLSGIKLEEDIDIKYIHLLAGKARKNGQGYEVAVEIRNNGQNGNSVVHSRARAILSADMPAPPVFARRELLNTNGYKRSSAEIYAKILFHGDALHGIQTVLNCTPQGMVARLNTAPPPQEWLSEPVRSRWIADPLVLDAAFQMASLWCYEQTGIVSLPSYGSSYRQYVRTFPQGTITCALEVKSVSAHKMVGDFTFLDANQTVVACLSGYEAVMDKALNKAFKPEGISG